jgi:type II secretory pathway component PulM
MPNEQTDRIVRLLEEIRDLTKQRDEKFDAYLQTSRQRYEEALQRQKEAQERVLAQRRRFLWTLAPLLLLAIGFMAYLAFWVIPKSERQDAERWMEQMRIVESNQVVQPH